MIRKKNLWFMTLFSLILVLSVYYITMPNDLLLEKDNLQDEDVVIKETNIIETLKTEDDVNTLDKISTCKETISNKDSTIEDKNKAFDEIKILNQISSQETLLEEQIKMSYDLDSFIKINEDQIRVVIDNDDSSFNLANNIMRTIQDNYDSKKYISVNFK